MMQDAIKNFASQFAYTPVIENVTRLKKKKRCVILGMGGSHLAADIAQGHDASLQLTIHSNYGLPTISPTDAKETLFIASSYSGNTEETVSGLMQAIKEKKSTAVICVDGKLLALAKKHNLPYVQLPDTGIQPRSALGYSLIAMLKLMGHTRGLKDARALAGKLKPMSLQPVGRSLARQLQGSVPVIYTSLKNKCIAYNWKIKLNETGKIPAFYNIFSELNHNEMTGFDVQPTSKKLSEIFHFVIIKDNKDHKQIQKRMIVLEKLYKQRGLHVTVLEISGTTPLERIFRSLIIADWTAIHTAELYGLESEQVPMVEEFKKHISSLKEV